MASISTESVIARDLGLDTGILPQIRVEELGVRRYAVIRGFEIGVMDRLEATISGWAIPGSHIYKYPTYAQAYRRFKEELGKGNRVACLGTDTAESRELYAARLRTTLMATIVYAGSPGSPAQSEPAVLQVPRGHGGDLRSPEPASPLSPRARVGDYDTMRGSPRSSRAEDVRHMVSAASSFMSSPSVSYEERNNSPPASPPRTPSPAQDVPQEQQPDHMAPWSTPAPTRPPFAPQGWVPPNVYTPPANRGIDYRPRGEIVDRITHTSSRKAWYVAQKSHRPGIYKTWQDAKNASPGAVPIAPGFMTYAEALAKWVELRQAGDIHVWT